METKNPYEMTLIKGDLSKLADDERLSYYKSTCDSLGLNYLTKPFEYITLNNKLVLYATRSCTDQLRSIKGISIEIVKRETMADIYVVTARASDKVGRVDESTGAVSIGGMRGDNLANAIMKAETKAKRRVTLSICGLGMLDETELETIPATAKQAKNGVTSQPKLDGNNDDGVTLDHSVSQEEEVLDSVLNFGKHRGKKWSELPTAYVAWLSEQDGKSTPRARQELDLRAGTNISRKDSEVKDDRPNYSDDDIPEQFVS